MKLYYVVGSPNCRKVHAVLNHLGITAEFEYLDFFAGETKKPEYLALNPNGMVPTLCDGDLVLWESNAIMQYLASKAPANTLYPKDDAKRADISRWQCWELAHFNKAFGALSFETVAKPNFLNTAPDEATVTWSKRELARHAPALESHLKGRKYLGRGRYYFGRLFRHPCRGLQGGHSIRLVTVSKHQCLLRAHAGRAALGQDGTQQPAGDWPAPLALP